MFEHAGHLHKADVLHNKDRNYFQLKRHWLRGEITQPAIE